MEKCLGFDLGGMIRWFGKSTMISCRIENWRGDDGASGQDRRRPGACGMNVLVRTSPALPPEIQALGDGQGLVPSGDRKFAFSLFDQFGAKGALSDKQWHWVKKLT